MNSSRRSVFGLFAAAAVIGASATTTTATVGAPAAPEAPKRKFFRGKPICGCEKPVWDAVYEAPRFYPSSGAHTHTISDPSHSHLYGGLHSHGFTTGITSSGTHPALHCAFCGGVQAPKA